MLVLYTQVLNRISSKPATMSSMDVCVRARKPRLAACYPGRPHDGTFAPSFQLQGYERAQVADEGDAKNSKSTKTWVLAKL
ncbi:hypothetical protein G3480_11050 [Thiorhodococcus mannitoliphagus]|uniref:Uncharacterized protein n=1 Tax=Thiorhodococcus mannitoliphagus TaxID=329406 RepID=A0A6P1DUH8_9GAMM|nr:hypothetical protein [Thiorhodococcus mannitoliphagus]NEX20843.1 hypothetical protein [Thiorhodococcus mannitoliphagus]